MFDLIENDKRILLIDPNVETAERFQKLLDPAFDCDIANGFEDAVARLDELDYAVIVFNSDDSDIALSVVRIKQMAPFSAVVVAGRMTTAEQTADVFRAGAFDFLFRPFQFEVLESAIKRATDHFETHNLKNRYQFHLESLAAERAAEIDKALQEVESSYRITLKALVQALETRDFETHGHSERVVTFSLRLGYELGLEKEKLRDLELGALLHDIGKIGVPDAILRKPAKLNEDEWAKMKLHPLHGQKILRSIRFLEGAACVVGQHHERWDGEGYPNGLRGEEIDLGARIFAVVDAFDAMISDRVYRRGRPYDEALAELEKCAGTQFDPLVIDAFRAIPREDWEILRRRSLMDKKESTSYQTVVAELIYSRPQVELVH